MDQKKNSFVWNCCQQKLLPAQKGQKSWMWNCCLPWQQVVWGVGRAVSRAKAPVLKFCDFVFCYYQNPCYENMFPCQWNIFPYYQNICPCCRNICHRIVGKVLNCCSHVSWASGRWTWLLLFSVFRQSTASEISYEIYAIWVKIQCTLYIRYISVIHLRDCLWDILRKI